MFPYLDHQELFSFPKFLSSIWNIMVRKNLGCFDKVYRQKTLKTWDYIEKNLFVQVKPASKKTWPNPDLKWKVFPHMRKAKSEITNVGVLGHIKSFSFW